MPYAPLLREKFSSLSPEVDERGIKVAPEVMIPLVAFATEYEHQESIVRSVAEEVLVSHGLQIPYSVGTMIELPRAALTANEIAVRAEFFSFGTNDLTQSTAASRATTPTAFCRATSSAG